MVGLRVYATLLLLIGLTTGIRIKNERPVNEESYDAVDKTWEDFSDWTQSMRREFDKIKFPTADAFKRRKKPFTINVEGIVGTGKSSLLRFLKGFPFFDVRTEPVDKWTNLNGQDLLGLIFTDPKRWSMAQESYVELTMLEEHLKNIGIVKAMERSIHSARACFIEYHYQAGNMQEAEYEILSRWYTFLNQRPEIDLTTDLTIYLKADPEVVFDRIKKRGRKEESTLQLSFLKDLSRLHEDWLMHRNSSLKLPSDNIIVIDTDRPFEIMKQVYKDLASTLWNKIPKELKTMCLP